MFRGCLVGCLVSSLHAHSEVHNGVRYRGLVRLGLRPVVGAFGVNGTMALGLGGSRGELLVGFRICGISCRILSLSNQATNK